MLSGMPIVSAIRSSFPRLFAVFVLTTVAFMGIATRARAEELKSQHSSTGITIEQPGAAARTGVAPRSSGLTIIPTFDSTITSDPRSAEIQATINAAIMTYKANFSDTVTVAIVFKKMSGGLGMTSTYRMPFMYSAYRTALISHATSADDATATASLPNVSNNPVNSNPNVFVPTPLARALGFTADPPAGQPDGTISLNTSVMNITAADTDPAKYSLFTEASHEIDEALGLGSILNGANNGDASPNNPVYPLDLFRYTQAGARSFTTSISAAAYFSLDGTVDLAQFNQNAAGDFSDWYSPGSQTPQVQDAFSTPGSHPVLGVELRALDAIGYTRVNGQPNLAPVTPSGWSDSIVISKVAGTNTDDSPLLSTDTLYVDFAFGNLSSTVLTNATFDTQLLVDNVVVKTVTQNPGMGFVNVQTLDVNIGMLTTGTHTVTMKIDSANTLAESNENDNVYTRTITVIAGPNLAPVTPSGWPDSIVVSKVTGTNTDDSPLLNTDTLYVDFAFGNLSQTGSTAAAFDTQLLIDGVVVKTVTQGAGMGFVTIPTLDVNIGALSAGNHSVTIRIDVGNTVVETSESDNNYTRIITITANNATAANLTLDSNAAITAPAAVAVGEGIPLASGVLNNGLSSAGSFIVRYWISTDTIIYSPGTVAFIGDATISSLGVGATATATFTGTMPNVAPGSYYLVWYINPLGQVAESNPNDNFFFSPTKITVTPAVAPNTPPVIVSGPAFAPASPDVNAPVTFNVAASDANSDALIYAWDFGDGATGSGASPVHPFAAAGTYTVTVSVSDGKGGTASGSVVVTVAPPAGPEIILSTATKKSFALNFARGGSDTLDIVIQNLEFTNAIKDGQSVSILIGSQVLDSAVFARGKATSAGKFSFNSRNGTIEYKRTKASLQSVLAPYGAANQTATKAPITIPIYFKVNDPLYGNDYSFSYTAKAGKTGKGK